MNTKKLNTIYDATFSQESKKLPTLKEIEQYIMTDRMSYDQFNMELVAFDFRDKYILESFPILTDDFFISL